MMRSIKVRISVWLSVAILVVAVLAGTASYRATLREAQAFQDNVLRQVVTLFDRQHLPAAPDAYVGKLASVDEDFGMFVQVFTADPDAHQAPRPGTFALPASVHEGMQTVRVGKDLYRTYVRTLSTGDRVAAAQDTDVRDEIAENSAKRTLAPFLALVPVLLIALGVLIRNLFKPVAEVARELDKRSDNDLHPIDFKSLPLEIQPFIVAINRLLARVEHTIRGQQRFVADAAHELRSPLTALSMQAEQLEAAEMSANARMRLITLSQGILRGRTLLEQLLTFARAQAESDHKTETVSIQKTLRRVLAELMPLVEAKSLDLGLNTAIDAKLEISEFDLFILIKNIIDNAIKYTPNQGQIDISILEDNAHIELVVEDNGPGIPDQDKPRVFDPFFRIPGNDMTGSGLGLSIVNSIAERFKARVMILDSTQFKHGLKVRTLFAK